MHTWAQKGDVAAGIGDGKPALFTATGNESVPFEIELHRLGADGLDAVGNSESDGRIVPGRMQDEATDYSGAIVPGELVDLYD